MIPDEAVEAAKTEHERWQEGFESRAGRPTLYTVYRDGERVSDHENRVEMTRALEMSAMRAALAAALPHIPVGAMVKGLEWVLLPGEEDWWTATTEVGLSYEVRIGRASVRVRGPGNHQFVVFEGTADEAKAAFQADYTRRILSSLAPMEGWKLVPVEPTEAMCEAGSRAWSDKPQNSPNDRWAKPMRRSYHAMLAAAPTPPTGGKP